MLLPLALFHCLDLKLGSQPCYRQEQMEWDISEQQSQTTLAMTFREIHAVSSMPTVRQIDEAERKSTEP